MEFKTLTYERNAGVAKITLNRPDAGNAVNLDLAKDLMHAVMRCDEDPNARALILAAAGKAFCFGGDLKSFSGQKDDLPIHLKETTTYLHAAVSRMTRMDAPVVAAVNGPAAGAGMSLACACDVVLAAESARFTMAYTAVALTPDGSSTYFLPRIVGLKRALELTLTNRSLTAAEAHDWGIVTKVVPDADLLDEAQSIAARFAAGPTQSLGAAKRLLHTGWTETLETQMESETQAIAAIAKTADAKEGITAFLEKRKPAFRNR
jgi:2-(1,2-epoxy-1,2-dihydrophenyl)acetyl-CoA isomerase